MTRVSRSRRAQPEFDPSELNDLILTPAVGSGVGSHLIVPAEKTTVDTLQVTTVDNSTHSEPIPSLPELSTVVISNSATVAVLPTVDRSRTNETTVVKSATPAAQIWMTEAGEMIPASRVRRIRLAQDVLNSTEESVYDTLWTAKPASKEEREMVRFIQAGYDFLMKRTRLSKKTIQRIIDRLIEKDFIEIDVPADIYHRTSTTYRVYSYRSVLERQAQKNRFHIAKIGPGFLYVHPLEPLNSKVNINMTTVDSSNQTTVVKSSTPTVAKDNRTTVVPGTTSLIGQTTLEQSSSSDTRALRALIEQHLGAVDDDVLHQLLQTCRNNAPDCTLEEIAYFVRHKLQWVRNIQNPVGFVLTAVPRHFKNNGHLSTRKLLEEEAKAKKQQWQDTYDYWSALATDPNQDESTHQEALKVLEILRTTKDPQNNP